jgi:cytochrome P450
MESMFSTQDPEYHKDLKRPVAQKFSMSSIKKLEYLVDSCSQIFVDAMIDMEGEKVDLGTWGERIPFARSSLRMNERIFKRISADVSC